MAKGPLPMIALNGRAALIISGTIGIGLATTRLFHEQDYAVLIMRVA